MQSRIQEDLAAKDTATKSQGGSRVAGINSNAVLDGKPESITTPFAGQVGDTPSANLIQLLGPSFTNVLRFTHHA